MASLFRNLADLVLNKAWTRLPDLRNSQAVQRHLYFQYQNQRHENRPLPDWRDAGFRVFSQSDEDGLLLLIFAIIGTTDKRCFEMGLGHPIGCNTTNLVWNWGWESLFFEADPEIILRSQKLFATHPDSWLYPPRLVQSLVSAENINDLLKDAGFSGETDLFSLDLDGNDYWVWKNLEVVQPRVVVAEYLNFWGPDQAMTIPYDKDFVRSEKEPDYFGASLAALTNLAREKGYRLIGSNRYDYNAFFLKSGVGEDYFPEVTVASCLQHPFALDAIKTRQPKIAHLNWVEV